MIIGCLAQARRYGDLFRDAERVFRFLKNVKGRTFSRPRKLFRPGMLYANMMVAESKGGGARLETHRKFVDLQYVYSGMDVIGWKAAEDCKRKTGYYSTTKDVIFYSDRPDTHVSLLPGMFCVLFPWDAHAPLAGKGKVRKIVVKIAMPLMKEYRP